MIRSSLQTRAMFAFSPSLHICLDNHIQMTYNTCRDVNAMGIPATLYCSGARMIRTRMFNRGEMIFLQCFFIWAG